MGSILSKVFAENMFYFYVDIGIYADRYATNLTDFYDAQEDVDIRSIEFHIGRGDFQKWINSLVEYALAKEILRLTKKALGEESPRTKLLDTVNKRQAIDLCAKCSVTRHRQISSANVDQIFNNNISILCCVRPVRACELPYAYRCINTMARAYESASGVIIPQSELASQEVVEFEQVDDLSWSL